MKSIEKLNIKKDINKGKAYVIKELFLLSFDRKTNTVSYKDMIELVERICKEIENNELINELKTHKTRR